MQLCGNFLGKRALLMLYWGLGGLAREDRQIQIFGSGYQGAPIFIDVVDMPVLLARSIIVRIRHVSAFSSNPDSLGVGEFQHTMAVQFAPKS